MRTFFEQFKPQYSLKSKSGDNIVLCTPSFIAKWCMAHYNGIDYKWIKELWGNVS